MLTRVFLRNSVSLFMLLLVGIRVAVEDCIALLLSRLNHMREFFIYVSHLFSHHSFRL